jgi:hypothetical protein
MLYDFPREVGFGDFPFKVESKSSRDLARTPRVAIRKHT